MTKNIAALIFILLCTSVGWAILGATILARTDAAGSGLGRNVESIWGKPQQQAPPVATSVRDKVVAPLTLERSRIRVALDLEQRKKGLLWFPTYRVAFSGGYIFRNTTDSENVTLKLVFPAPEAIYDGLVFRIDGEDVPTRMEAGAVATTLSRLPGSVIRVDVAYRSQGLGSWHYSFGENVVQVRDFVMQMTTDFKAIDFPQGTLAPHSKVKTREGWGLEWKYTNLVTGYRIGMVMPEKLQPGPLAGRISFFAPVSLLFFFFMIFIITTLKRIELHPMHYFFLATSFFSFHLLLAYLVDHISIHLAFAICSVVSIFLVVSYLRIVVGPRFAFVEAALAQLVYLVGFSYAFFFKGFTGLAVTIGAILSLFLVMQLTARIDWGGARTASAT